MDQKVGEIIYIIDLAAANDCMKKGLEILANPDNVLPSSEQTFTGDTQGEMDDLWQQFFSDTSISVEAAQARYVEIIANADWSRRKVSLVWVPFLWAPSSLIVIGRFCLSYVHCNVMYHIHNIVNPLYYIKHNI